jgi:GNAT superfamily N-acetyltransferase
MSSEFKIRQATPEDAQLVMDLVQELADYEEMPNGPKITADHMKADLARGAVFVKLAFCGEECAGLTLYYFPYSSWVGQVRSFYYLSDHTLFQFMHMEDLYVRPNFRKRGLAKLLVSILAKEALDKGMTRINWDVLNW